MDVEPSSDIAMLLSIMRALRDPVNGCPWDVEQSFETIAPYTIEEAYEVADAIDRGDMDDLCDELGDLLLQVVYHSQLASDAGRFGFGDVVLAITRKMIRRHPHVFGEERAQSAQAAKLSWEASKQAERAGRPDKAAGFLGDIPDALPATMAALKLQRKAATVGFDWPEAAQVLGKIDEELAEIRTAIAQKESASRIQDEVGDLLFAVVNLARHLDIDPDTALRGTNRKFRRRFNSVEDGLARQGRDLGSASLDEMEELWVKAKQAERPTAG
ncbi:MAG: nucleoside triphosphate pyrophosphohydrolase [Methylobacterium mesophilicum]|nr:nucleoside triphosphate pyrophosphohydrolase [Methylobacterium mesophilicum]